MSILKVDRNHLPKGYKAKTDELTALVAKTETSLAAMTREVKQSRIAQADVVANASLCDGLAVFLNKSHQLGVTLKEVERSPRDMAEFLTTVRESMYNLMNVARTMSVGYADAVDAAHRYKTLCEALEAERSLQSGPEVVSRDLAGHVAAMDRALGGDYEDELSDLEDSLENAPGDAFSSPGASSSGALVGRGQAPAGFVFPSGDGRT